METIKEYKFRNVILDDYCKLFNLKMEDAQNYFEDYLDYYVDIIQDENSLKNLIDDLGKIDQELDIDEIKAKALYESFEILFENAIALKSSELYFDVLYSILHGLVNKVKNIAQAKFSQTWVINKSIMSNLESSIMSSCFFV